MEIFSDEHISPEQEDMTALSSFDFKLPTGPLTMVNDECETKFGVTRMSLLCYREERIYFPIRNSKEITVSRFYHIDHLMVWFRSAALNVSKNGCD